MTTASCTPRPDGLAGDGDDHGRNPWQEPRRPALSHGQPKVRHRAEAMRKASPTTDRRLTHTALVARLESENLTLQQTLMTERKRCAELRLALETQVKAAITDPLTGLYNRRAMDQHLRSLWNARDGAPVSVLMLDIDHFKRINDLYGHPRGDQVIRQMAEILRRCLRAEDCAFRYGGEEFMVLLPNTPLAGALQVAEAIRGRVESRHFAEIGGNAVRCTVSLGVASGTNQEHCDNLFLRADRALYLAKRQGRNRVAHEDPEP